MKASLNILLLVFSCFQIGKVCATTSSTGSTHTRQHESNHIFCSHFKKRVVHMMLLKDLAFPDSGRLLQASTDSTSDEDSRGPFNQIAISVVGVGLLLLCAIWCISSVRSGSATRVVNVTLAPVLPQDERAGGAIQSTLQRKQAILELFRTSQVTMVRYEVYPQ